VYSAPKPRYKQIEHVYSALYYNERVKDAVEAQLLIDHAKNPLPLRKAKRQDIVTQQRLTKEHWLAESPEIQAIVKARRKSDYEAAVAEWEARNRELGDPQRQQM
jgi:hypothetical protein